MNRSIPLFGLLMLGVLLFACNEKPFQKTKDFTSEVLNYEFYIEGEIDGRLLRYRQINYDGINTANKYFIGSQETWLQAYMDSIDPDLAYWNIRLHDLDIRSLEFPYQLKESEGYIAWYDQRIDAIIENNSNCQGIDSGCTFFLSSDENIITLTSNNDNILEGIFSGRAMILGIGFQPYRDESLFHDIVNGRFRIKYRVE